ncbi:MAG: PilN domain-containing protein [Candidatus Omnitrophica bacterium]|nr:PilN domain-containing protein [Candidatus Omnitrophota bacterium]
MITVNLLPEGYRKPTATSIRQFHRSPLALGAAGLLIGVGVLLAALGGLGHLRLAGLQARIHALAAKKQAIDEVKAVIATLREQERVFEQLDRRRSHWARRLNVLSDLTPEGVWFSDLALDAQGKLTFQGAAISQGGEAMASVNRLVQTLKADQSFSPIIRDIQIESIQNVQEGEIELMKFALICDLIPPPAASTP